jgi:hypothetical protein
MSRHGRLGLAGVAARLVLLLTATAPARLCADEYPGCRYVGGVPELSKPMKGLLVVDASGVHLKDEKDRALLSLPIATIEGARRSTRDAVDWTQTGPASGVAAWNTEDFVAVDSRTQDGTRTVLFKVPRRQGSGIAAKIRFWVDKARTSEPPPSVR